jgi:lipoprotein NlpI
MMRVFLPALMMVSFVLTGCANLSQEKASTGLVLPFMPRQPDPQLEIAIAKLSDVLHASDLTDEQRAKIFYDRGVRYDSVGLRTLARIDFSRTLQIKPDLADAYNFMGIYFTQAQEYDRAYEAFGAVLELDPSYDFAFLNRGIAEYYGNRQRLAAQDMEVFFLKDKNDPYRVIWLYLAEYEQDPAQAIARLTYNRQRLSNHQWSTKLVDLFLGKVSPEELLSTSKDNVTEETQFTERLCEAYFYLGKHARLAGANATAMNYFRLALATNVYEFVEHRYALVEVRELTQEAAAKRKRLSQQ